MMYSIRRDKLTKNYILEYSNPITNSKHRVQFQTRKDAEEYVWDEEMRIDSSMFVKIQSLRKNNRITLSELIAIYKSYCGLRPVTRKQDSYILDMLEHMFGDREVRSFTRVDLLVWREKFRRRGLKQNTIRKRIYIFRAVVGWAFQKGILSKNPFENVMLPVRETISIMPPTDEEISAILRHACPHIQRVIIIGLFTGARIGPSELLSLKWDDIDYERMIIRMPAARKGQGAKFREIPIREGLLPWLRIWQEADAFSCVPWIIHYAGRAVGYIGQAWRHALRRAGITRAIRPYDLRHAFATNALECGADIGAVAAVMGHRGIGRILDTYQHVRDGLRRESIELFPGIRPLSGGIGRDNGHGIHTHS